ncbi:MAG: 3-hydroxyacyl-CoA dehydrogenase/enoyl-CoA hydratase family protein [Desulfobacteraceae bacterium]|nr:3-hydroxyacyl-CoA dehydrogenase/enoyl-CoA hydratase family protein [Desulfobacteraceae bacterium]
MSAEKKLYKSFQNPLLIQPKKPLPKQMAVIGAGTIGPDIGYYLKSAMPSATLYLVDVVDKPLENAKIRLEGYAKKAVDKRKMSPEKAEAVLKDIYYTKNYEDLAGCDLIIEAATENIPLKQKIFDGIERIVSEDAIITSNSSSIPADRMFNKMKHPERTTVTHFFAPAWRSLPVEVIRWDGASDETIDYLYWFFGATGKAPIITDNAICFVLDRIFDNWCNEAAYLLGDATAGQIDKVAEEFVFAGPFFVLNMANGNPIIVETNTLQMEEGDCYKPAHILNSVDRWQTLRPGSKVDVAEDIKSQIRDRLLGILFSQSVDIGDREIGTKSDLNFGCQVALGFRNGPLDTMRELGADETRRIMDRFGKERPGFPAAKAELSGYQKFNRFILEDDMDGVKILTIRRPQAMNALNDEITDELLEVFQSYENDADIKGFIVIGYGESAFSAGADIGKFPRMLGDKAASIQYAKDCAKLQRYMDQMQKPVVAALNGMALGGGLELAIRCHSIVSMARARLQFPEITLGIIPGIGGCTVPYRRWPKGAALFNDMIVFGKAITAEDAGEIGMVSDIASTYPELIEKAIAEVNRLNGNLKPLPEGAVDIPQLEVPDEPMAGKMALPKASVAIAVDVIRQGAAAKNFYDALDVGYTGFGDVACTADAKEGITAFLQKRKPAYNK